MNVHIRGIGVDAVAIERMNTQRMGMHVIQRLFHPDEVAEALELSPNRRAEFLASRFAAKEAFVKALGTGFRGIAPKDIWVSVDGMGRPSIQIDPTVKATLDLDSAHIHLSLTHEQSFAIAFVVVEDGYASL
jgi:holo-[acyl-carrier protein] synthase